LVKNIVGIFLNGERGVFEEGKVFDQSGVVQIDQNTCLFTLGGFKNGAEEAHKIERRKRGWNCEWG
jgi:hypothetical protein